MPSNCQKPRKTCRKTRKSGGGPTQSRVAPLVANLKAKTSKSRSKDLIDSIRSLLINNIRDLRDDIDDCKDSLENNPSDKIRRKLKQLQEKLELTNSILDDLRDAYD